jgi:hypothetical protein
MMACAAAGGVTTAERFRYPISISERRVSYFVVVLHDDAGSHDNAR